MRLYWKVLLEGQTLAMVLHHWLAAVSVAAIAALLLATSQPSELAAGVGAAKWAAQDRAGGDAVAIARRNWLVVVAARRTAKSALGRRLGFDAAIRRVAGDGLGFDAPSVDDRTRRPPPRRRRSHRRPDGRHNSTDGRHTPTRPPPSRTVDCHRAERHGTARNGTEAVPYSADGDVDCGERPPWRSAVGLAVTATISQAVAVLRPLAQSLAPSPLLFMPLDLITLTDPATGAAAPCCPPWDSIASAFNRCSTTSRSNCCGRKRVLRRARADRRAAGFRFCFRFPAG